MKSGFVSLIGRPNVGKSTILNKILKNKISIVSPKSQTTRDNIQGIYNDDECQIVFIDTPGIHKPKNDLGVYLDKKAYSSIRSSDLVIYVIDSSRKYDVGDDYLFEHLKIDKKVIFVFNKIDLATAKEMEELKEIYKNKVNDAIFIETSAIEDFNIDFLIKTIKENLEEGPQYYDTTTVSDKDFSFQVQEIVREKCLQLLEKEVPHGVAVICEHIQQSNKEIVIDCKIICEKESQKGIIIGSKGAMIKKIGINARKDLEEITKKHIVLNLIVRIVEDWRNNSSYLVKLGYK